MKRRVMKAGLLQQRSVLVVELIKNNERGRGGSGTESNLVPTSELLPALDERQIGPAASQHNQFPVQECAGRQVSQNG